MANPLSDVPKGILVLPQSDFTDYALKRDSFPAISLNLRGNAKVQIYFDMTKKSGIFLFRFIFFTLPAHPNVEV